MPSSRREISFSQGAAWKALISTYIGTMPPTADGVREPQNRRVEIVIQ